MIPSWRALLCTLISQTSQHSFYSNFTASGTSASPQIALSPFRSFNSKAPRFLSADTPVIPSNHAEEHVHEDATYWSNVKAIAIGSVDLTFKY